MSIYEEKMRQLEKIAEEIRKCGRCGLSKTRRNPVPGEGNPDSTLVFIGEAPGYWEDVKGKPFVGAAGRLLDEILEKVGIKRKDVFITNVLKCRPPRNRDPRPEEVRVCTPFLDRQLKVIKPRIIMTLGRHSTAYIFSKMNMKFYGITRVHGQIYEAESLGWKCYVIPTFHPAAALYNVNLRDDLLKDLLKMKSILETSEKT
ncbi:uracil-DNA glycosylase [Candidatus Bathyarchaeota archaeon]|nr:uracil-DNA glycosylase [Candidatus Bathyarchaeota archaeon]